MKRFILLTVLLLLLTLLASISSCEKNPNGNDAGDAGNNSQNIIYTAGSYQTGSVYVACYWKHDAGNIDKVDLNQGVTESEAKDIYVDNNNNIHIAGTYDTKPVYWLDDGEQIIRTELTTETQSEANSIFVDDAYIYIGGKIYNGTKDVAVFWEINRNDLSDIVVYEATDGSMNAYVNSIYVYNEDVYLAGRYRSSSEFVACYWKYSEGTFTTTDLETSTAEAEATDIYVETGMVYVSGKYVDGTGYYIAGYWKGAEGNLTSYTLPEGHVNGSPNSLFIYDGIVYIGGHYQNESHSNTTVASYWLDDGSGNIELISLTDGITTDSYVKSVFVNEDGVYSAGYTLPQLSTSVAAYWFTGGTTEVINSTDGSYRAKSYSIFIY